MADCFALMREKKIKEMKEKGQYFPIRFERNKCNVREELSDYSKRYGALDKMMAEGDYTKMYEYFKERGELKTKVSRESKS